MAGQHDSHVWLCIGWDLCCAGCSVSSVLDQAALSAECIFCATLSHCQRHIHVRRIALPFKVCHSRVGASVCEARLACICTCLQWFLTHPCASSMWNLDSSLHRDTEDTVHYHFCVAFQMCKLLCQGVRTLMSSMLAAGRCFWPQCTLAVRFMFVTFL